MPKMRKQRRIVGFAFAVVLSFAIVLALSFSEMATWKQRLLSLGLGIALAVYGWWMRSRNGFGKGR
jgi:hypothetical protein